MDISSLRNYIVIPLFTIGIISLAISLIIAGLYRTNGGVEGVQKSNLIIKSSVALLVLLVLVFPIFLSLGGSSLPGVDRSFTPKEVLCTTNSEGKLDCGGFVNKVACSNPDSDECKKLNSANEVRDACILTNPVGVISDNFVAWITQSPAFGGKTCEGAISDATAGGTKAFLLTTSTLLTQYATSAGAEYLFSLPVESINLTGIKSFLFLMEGISVLITLSIFIFTYWKRLIEVVRQERETDMIKELWVFVMAILSIYIIPFILEIIIRICQSIANLLGSELIGKEMITFFAIYADQGLASAIYFLLFLFLFLVLILAFLFMMYKNIKRYVVLIVLYVLSPIFAPMFFIEETRGYFYSLWNAFLTNSFSLVVELVIMNIGLILANSIPNKLFGLIIAIFAMFMSVGSDSFVRDLLISSSVSQSLMGNKYVKSMQNQSIKAGQSLRTLVRRSVPMPQKKMNELVGEIVRGSARNLP